MRESELEKWLVDYCVRRNCLTYKFTSPQNKGVPDRIIIAPNGKVGFLELKQKGKKPTKLQIRRIEEIQAQGVAADWADDKLSCRTFVNQLTYRETYA